MKANFRTIIYCFTIFASTLLAYRIFKTGSIYYLFLVWNLFLAFIPYWISKTLVKKAKPGLIHLPAMALWLLFVPNSPYLLTDLFHLKPDQGVPFWLDLILVLSFALIGLVIFFRSFIHMIDFLKIRVSAVHLNYIIPFTMWLIAFGLYLGRYGRFNSWDILQAPYSLAKRSYHLLFNKDAMAFTCIFSIFMWLVYLTLINFNPKEQDA